MVVCHCAAVNDRVLRELTPDHPTLEAIGAACGAGQDCGSCIGRIEALLAAEPSEVGATLRLAS